MEKTIKAQLILENGARFHGTAFGYVKETVGEVVFNTGMTGYQELLTDPSYCGQLVVCTYPLIGNYGINLDDMESDGIRLRGLIVRELCRHPNNWRCELDLDSYLKQNKVMGIEGIDTRALTKMLRDEGNMRAIITTRGADMTASQIKQKFQSLNNKNVIRECTIAEPYELPGSGVHFAFLDMGAKRGILRDLQKRGCRITVFPAFTPAEEILAVKPDALFLSNGPGDPMDVPEILETVKTLMGKLPVIGICMGHQLIGLALGCQTRKMKFGHHGANHPVRDERTGRVYITSQNHEYEVCNLPEDVEVTFTNINDGSVEGIAHKSLPVYSVQFHPEASPGPLDTGVVFDKMLEVVKGGMDRA